MIRAAAALAIIAWCGTAHADVAVYVPHVMMLNTPYEGMVLLDEPAQNPRTLLLYSDGPVTLQSGVTVPAGRNHGIFGIYPYGTGEASITALPAGGPPVSAASTIHEEPAGGLRLIVPGAGSLGTPHMPVFVVLTDGYGNAAPADRPVQVLVDAPHHMGMPDAVTVPRGHAHAGIPAAMRGPGAIHVSAGHAASDSAWVYAPPGDVRVRVGAAPNPAPEGSAVAYAVWLERDGAVYAPPGDVAVRITSDSPAASTTPGPGPGKPHRGMMSGGVYTGTIYTGQAAGPGDGRLYGDTATITATISGVGSGSHTVTVGAQPSDAAGIIAGEIQECLAGGGHAGGGHAGGDHTDCGHMLRALAAAGGAPDMIDDAPKWLRAAFRAADITPRADTAVLWALPDAPHHHALVVAGFYATGGMPGVRIPAPPPDIREIVSSHAEPRLHSGAGPVTIPVETPVPLNLTVHGGGVRAAHLALPGAPGDALRIAWEPAPPGGELLGVAYATDTAGRAVHPGGRLSNLTVQGYGGAEVYRTMLQGAAAAVYGSVDGPGGLLARLPGAPPARIDTGWAHAGRSLDLWMPQRVRISEEFPYAIHLARGGSPASRVHDALLLSESISRTPGGRLIADYTGGGMSAIYDGNAVWGSTRPFLNEMDQVYLEVGERRVHLGQNVTISVREAPPGSMVYADGPLEFRHVHGHTYTARPPEAGLYAVNVTVRAPGWSERAMPATYEVDSYADVSYGAVADGSAPVPFALHLESGGTSYTMLPGETIAAAPGAYTATLEQNPRINGDGYSLAGVDIDGEYAETAGRLAVTVRGPTRIVSHYTRVVDVYAEYAGAASGQMAGSGQYKFGEMVSLHAGEVSAWWGLARAVPEYWEGLPPDAAIRDGTARFAAVQSADILAVYRNDYSPLVLLAAAGAALPVVMMRGRITDMISDIRGGRL